MDKIEDRIDRRWQNQFRHRYRLGKAIEQISLCLLIAAILGACSSLVSEPAVSQPGPAPTVFVGFASTGQGGERAQASLNPPEVVDLFSPTTTELSGGLFSLPASMTPASDTPEPGWPGADEGSSTPVNASPRPTSTPSPTQTEPPAEESAAVMTSTPIISAETATPQPGEDLLSGLSQYRHQYIYRDAFFPGWKAFDSWNTYYSLGERRNVRRGRYAIVVKPVEDYGGMFFNLGEWKDQEAVLREDVAGVSFWINPGNNPLHPDDLAVTVVGSNQYPYWVKLDNSVEIDNEEKFFSETRLSLLGFNHELDPDTWYQVILWLDNLPFDPDYKYLTGFYIKNDAGFKSTYYLDDVSLIGYAE